MTTSSNSNGYHSAPPYRPQIPASAQDTVFIQILETYQKAGAEFIESICNLLADECTLLAWAGEQPDTLIGIDAIKSKYLNKILSENQSIQRLVGRAMVGGGGVAMAPDSRGSVLVLYYVAHATKEGIAWQWPGVDILTVREGKVIDWRVQEDTYSKYTSKPERYDMQIFYEVFDRCYQPLLTTNNQVGMSFLVDCKRTVMTTEERMTKVFERVLPDSQMATVEADSVVLLNGSQEIWELMGSGLQTLYPDFYENIERVVICGNAMVMLQNPSGMWINPHGVPKHNAWFNCDTYFFDSQNICGMLFIRDVGWQAKLDGPHGRGEE